MSFSLFVIISFLLSTLIDVPKPVISNGFKVLWIWFCDTITLCRINLKSIIQIIFCFEFAIPGSSSLQTQMNHILPITCIVSKAYIQVQTKTVLVTVLILEISLRHLETASCSGVLSKLCRYLPRIFRNYRKDIETMIWS